MSICYRRSIFIQGGSAEAQEESTQNAVLACLTANQLPDKPGQPAIVVNDGLAGNVVHVAAFAQGHERRGGVVAYYA